MANIGGTKAVDMKANIDTIEANMAFDEWRDNKQTDGN
jgi:hypothetical protein